MNALLLIAYLSAILYGILIDGTYFKIYFTVLIIYHVLTQVIFIDKSQILLRKQICVSSWGEPTDPTCYLVIEYDVEKALQYIKKLNATQQDVKFTLTHIFARAIGFGMSKMRRDIGRIKWGNFQPSKEIGLTVLVDQDGGRDLNMVTVWEPQKMSMLEMGISFNEQIAKVKSHKNKEHKDMMKTGKLLPTYLLGIVQTVVGYLSQNCGWSFPMFKVKGNSWGQTVLTNVGSIGIEEGFAPICPPVNAQFLACAGKAVKKPVVIENDKIVVKTMCKIVYTLDHRYGDASLVTKMLKILKDYIEDPENFKIENYEDSKPYSQIQEKGQI